MTKQYTSPVTTVAKFASMALMLTVSPVGQIPYNPNQVTNSQW